MSNDVWEYYVVEKNPLAFRTCGDEQKFLNNVGSEGWEHYNTAVNNVARVYYFKKLIKAKPVRAKKPKE